MKINLIPKTSIILSFLFIAVTVLTFTSVQAFATVTVDDAFDSFNTGVGNYYFVSGNDAASSPGQVEEVLGGTLGGAANLQSNGSESGTYSLDM